MRYDIIEKLGEGNRGEVYKVKLEDGTMAALKWAKRYDIDKEWEILSYLNGKHAPKPIFRGKRFFIMELVEGKTLKELIGTKEFYILLKNALKAAYELDLMGIFHKQLGRFYHIVQTKNGVKFLDFERAVFSDNPRNFLQIVGYYLKRDENFNKDELEEVIKEYKVDKKRGLKRIEKLFEGILI